ADSAGHSAAESAVRDDGVLRMAAAIPLIRFIAFLTGGVNAMLAARYLIVIVVGRELGASEAAIGVIIGIGSIGAIIGSMIGGFIQKRFGFGQAIIGIVWIIVIVFPFHAIAPNYIVLGVVTAIIVMMVPIYNVVQVSYRLSLIPDELQGRVNSAVRLIAYGFQPLGAILCGFLLERFGSTTTVLVFTAWTVVWGTLAALNRHVREARPVSQLG
ncbi:MAG: MFS transporter, partial [Anaerolineales bacterium]